MPRLRSRVRVSFPAPDHQEQGKPRLPFVLLGWIPRRDSKAVMQRIANPSSPVRLRVAPPASVPPRLCQGSHRGAPLSHLRRAHNAPRARMAKSADAADLKSAARHRAYGFDPRSGHHPNAIRAHRPTPRGRPHDDDCPRRAERGCAQARGLRLGDVRLRQLGLHHGRPHGRLQRLLRGRGRRRRRLGHAGLDAGAGRCRTWWSCSRCRRSAPMPTCARPRSGCCCSPPPAAWRPPPGWPTWGRATWRWRSSAIVLSNLFYAYGESLIAAFLPELARREAIGQRLGLGLELRLFRRHADAGPEPGLRDLGAGAGHDGAAVRAGDDAHHRRRLRPGRRWPPSRC